ncbi:MAG: Gfo/Idh/MocA family oxidoreductase [Bryobacteraceae bacterium]
MVRFGVVGMGHISRKAIVPAFANTRNAQLVAVFSGDSAKRTEFDGFSYEDFEKGLAARKVDAVFIGVPNHMHRDFAVRAARAGVHVLCEKPLAASAADCEAMIAATKAAGVQLMVAYRHQFGSAQRDVMETAHSGRLGDLRSFHSIFAVQVYPGNVRTVKAAGGGTLWDLGVYCINTARQVFQAEPDHLTGFATTREDDPRFAEVEEMFTAVMEFPGHRIATFTCSFGSARYMTYDVLGTKGTMHLDPAYDYAGDIRSELIVDGKRETRIFPREDQFAAQIDYFAECVREGREPAQSGAEALTDVRIIEQLYRSTL